MLLSGKILYIVYLPVLISAPFLIKHLSCGGYFLILEYQTSVHDFSTSPLNKITNTSRYLIFSVNQLPLGTYFFSCFSLLSSNLLNSQRKERDPGTSIFLIDELYFTSWTCRQTVPFLFKLQNYHLILIFF